MHRQKQIFTIQQVSLKLNIPKPTLRFWEKEFNDLIVTLRTQGGQRRYTLDHIATIAEIKKLREGGMSVIEIKKYFKNRSGNNENRSESGEIDFLADHIAEIVRSEIYNFFNFTANSVEE
jgi:DNA-binding transcriptional MerR regulator